MTGEVEVVRRGEIESHRTTTAARARLLAGAFLAGYSGRTLEAYRCDLHQWWSFCDQVDVEPLAATRAHVQVYGQQLEQAGRSPATIARKLSAIAGFYAYCTVEGEIPKSPAAHVRRPRVSDESPRLGLDRHELARLLAAAEAHGPEAYALICLLALNGLRVSEACGARVEDLDDVRGHRVLTVQRKGGKRAQFPLAPRTAAAIAELPSMTQGLEDAAGSRVSPPAPGPAVQLIGLDRFGAGRLVRHLAAAAGITKRISPHSLRHSFCTLALDAGVALRDVQDAMGHADPRTTRRYDRGRQSLDRHATYAVASFVDVDQA